jgi:hypothetical protein
MEVARAVYVSREKRKIVRSWDSIWLLQSSSGSQRHSGKAEGSATNSEVIERGLMRKGRHTCSCNTSLLSR